MKYAVFLLLVVVAMAAAAPQLLAPSIYGGLGYYGIAPRTVVAGPTVLNTPLGLGGHYINPGYIGTYY